MAHAHARRGRDNERLHAREPSARGIRRVLALLLFKQHGDHLRQQTQRQNPRPYRIENARRNQKQNHERESDRAASRQRNPHQIAPQKPCHTLDDSHNRVHPHIPLFPITFSLQRAKSYRDIIRLISFYASAFRISLRALRTPLPGRASQNHSKTSSSVLHKALQFYAKQQESSH